MNSVYNWLRYCIFAVISLQMIAASDKTVIYWGQNSIGSFTNDKSRWEKPLRTYCQDSTYDVIVVGFVYLFPTAQGSTLPGMNFANHCEQPFDSSVPMYLNCTANIAPDIDYCQQRGKTILLSFGGGVGTYGFTSEQQGGEFATTVWKAFLGGSGLVRPFGNSIFDGVDLDIEGGSDVGYKTFISTLRSYFATSSRKYYISSAPQCFYPDRIQSVLVNSYFDWVFIQFYNNHCGVQSFGTTTFNFDKWAAYAATAVNPNMKLFIGAPASPNAAASGYVTLSTLQTIATSIKTQYPSVYGGIMLWDACMSDDNNNYGVSVSAFVHDGSSAPTPVPIAAATTGTSIVRPSTTANANPIKVTTGKVIPASMGTTATPMVGTSTSSVPVPIVNADSGNCVTGNMKCLSDSTFSTCAHSVWGQSQSCYAGTSCSQQGQYIYCLPTGTTPVPVAPTPVTPTPVTPTPVTPTPVTPTPVTPTPVTPTPVIPAPTTPAPISVTLPTDGSCATIGDQQCVGSNSYRICSYGESGPTWSTVMFCQASLSCHPVANNVYCY